MEQLQLTDYNNTEEKEQGNVGLELQFSLGYNSSMTGAVHNLTYEKNKEIFFPAAHTGIIYNYETGQQKLLQGHCNAITACNSIYDPEENKRYIVTADSGKNAMIVIWNADDGSPHKFIFHNETDQIISIEFAKNQYYIAWLSHVLNEKKEVVSQRVYLYLWKPKVEQVYFSEFGLEDGEIYNSLRFNPNTEEEIIEYLVMSPNKIYFSIINLKNSDLSRAYYPWPIQEKSLPPKKGQPTYTQSTFLYKRNTAITGTTAGYIIVWEKCEALCKDNEIKTDRQKIKTVELLGKYKNDKDKNMKKQGCEKDHINILLNYEELIVIGSGGGTVNFYDYNFIIVRWFENICWMVKSISFDMGIDSTMKNNRRMSHEKIDMQEESGNTNKFTCIPFITADVSATVIRVYNSKYAEIDYNDGDLKFEEIYRGVESSITSIAVHPKLKLIAVGTKGNPPTNAVRVEPDRQKDSILKEKRFEYRPYVQLFSYPNHMGAIQEEDEKKEKEEELREFDKRMIKKESEISKRNKKQTRLIDDENDPLDEENYVNPHKKLFNSVIGYPTVLEFSPDGRFLMVGTSNQNIILLNPENVSNILSVLQVKEVADHIQDEKHKNVKIKIKEIIFAPDEIHFAATDNNGRIGLFKLESDNQWDMVGRHHFTDNQILSFCFSEDSTKIYAICIDRYLYELDAMPSNSLDEMNILPKKRQLRVEYDCDMSSIILSPLITGKDRNVMIANNEFKIRTVVVNILDQMTIRQTSLGPCYGSPIKMMKVIPGKDKDRRILAFSTYNKIMGLMYLPMDGNPYRYMGVIGHPDKIKDIRPVKNLNYIFTTGGSDYTINAWKYHINPLIDAVQSGGEGIDPFMKLLEGGREGVKYQDMLNYFYYAQIKSKDENTTKHRILTQTVPIAYIHGLLASLDFYPSIEDINNIRNEVRSYKNFTDNERLEINFDTFVKLYLNHRPYEELNVDEIEGAYINIREEKEKKEPKKEQVKETDIKKDLSKTISRDDFLRYIKEYGEKIDDKELGEILQVLRGDSNPNTSLPEKISFQFLFEELLLMEKEEKELNK